MGTPFRPKRGRVSTGGAVDDAAQPSTECVGAERSFCVWESRNRNRGGRIPRRSRFEKSSFTEAPKRPIALPPRRFSSYLDTMPLPFDATLKSIVAENFADFAPLFGLPTNEPAVAVNVDLSLLTAATDVAIAFGKPMKAVADINFQSVRDPTLPGRLHLYNAVLFYRHGVPVRSVLMLLRKKADAENLTGILIYGEGPNRVEFNYEIIRLWELPVDAFLNGGLAALPLAVLA
ncbi:MAG: hypothetical protein ACRC1K_18815 [Planctomycetia bacterium]